MPPRRPHEPPWRGFQRGEPQYRRIVAALFAAGFATFTQIFDAQAVLPALRDELGVSAPTAALSVSAATVGIALSVLPWASVADRIGRVQAMRISLTAATLLAFLVPLMPTFETVLLARGLVGLALGAVPAVAVAYLAEELHVSWVSVAAGTYIAGNTIGGIAGRLIAGPVSELAGWRAGLAVVAVAGALAAALFWLLVPEPRGFVRAGVGDAGSDAGGGALRLRTRILFQLRDPTMLALYAQGFFLMGAFAVVYNYLGFRITAPPFLLPSGFVSLLFLAYLSGTVSSRFSGALLARFGALRVIVGGVAVMLVGLALLVSEALPVVIVGLVVFTVGCFTAHPVASGLSGRSALVGRAQATALYQLSWLGGTSLFGWLVGLVYDRAGWNAMLVVVAGMGLSAAVAALLGLGLLRSRRPVPPTA
ncbi:MFS transporter [Herbiconiux sp. CPCC 203407]|uniref:MFS transporter n=1 Tax=Herbiconiux oxytropis TaxID=2970915 RepID=A0AA41XGB4_9MICO|nr:MFS transporter [Herbiconiux oxytropis]MCS5722102.1 MFS transporter [Herbiconiux oxytropis]MCS5725684.1 MFS transporter [Herbiconiux oxytropis]